MVKVRTVRLRDGRYELVRLLSNDDLAGWSKADPLAYEKSIVWLEDIESLRYVRAVQVRCAKSRRGPLRLNSGERVVGYSKLLPNAPRDPQTDRYTRRLFYLKPCDIETEHGWILLTHGVGAMRRYCIGAMLLDLNDPSRVLAASKEPLLCPNEQEREGYVPNVVYSCGAMLHGDQLIIPYAMADSATSIATLSVDDLMEHLGI